MKKSVKRELLIALIVCIIVLGASFYVNAMRPNSHYSGSPYAPQALSSPDKLIQTYGLPGPFTQTSFASETENQRIKDIRQSISGELRNGTFEEVVIGVEDETDRLGGYTDSEDVTFTENLWSGEIVSKIPQDNSLKFVFKVRSLISTNGKVVSITTNIKDITPTTNTTTQKPMATVRTTLKEISENPSDLNLPKIELPFVAAIGPYLSTFFTWVITGLAIGLPAYFTVLGVVLLIDRGLIPIANKLFKRGAGRHREALPSKITAT